MFTRWAVLNRCRGFASAVLLAGFSLAFTMPLKAESPIEIDRREQNTNADSSPIGRQVDPFTLDNIYGKAVSLSDFEDRELIAIVFLGVDCPLAKLYGPRLNDIRNRYARRGVEIIGINSNRQDSLTEVGHYARRHAIEFPMLKDPGNRIADALGAMRTPEVFLLDRDRVVRYHGRIDDQYGVGYSRERDAEPELTAAIDDVLAGKPVAKSITEPVGCFIGRSRQRHSADAANRSGGEVTFNGDIAAILNDHCVRCHRDGEIAPFSLARYEDVLGWEDTILEVIADNRMPPWNADPRHGRFSNDARLSPVEKALLRTWVDLGMPEGDPTDRPDAPEFADGWQIGEPDEVIMMDDEPFNVPAEGIIDYQRFVIDPGWDEDRYIVAAEARPDRRTVVHHILVYVIPPGAKRLDLRKTLVGYAPGTPPLRLTDGVALEIKAGSRLLFEMHYTPNGSPQTDRSYIGLKFTDKSNVRKRLRGRIAINTKFRIPPGASDHEVVARYRSRDDERLLDLTPHMHLRGKSFRYDVTFPDGRKDTLLNVPNYDFNWQLKYILDEPVLLPKGTVVTCTAVFDNSESNLTNPDPTKPVRWGDQSFEEMMIGFLSTVPVADEWE